MRPCPNCGKPFAPDVRFCPDDGTPLTDTAAQRANLTPAAAGEVTELKLPVIVGNRYRLVELRGGGGMAQVYRAIDTTLERTVAVKIINQNLRKDPQFDARFQREARIASQLADPHTVVVHDFGIDPEHGPFLVMQFLQGQSLRERLREAGPLPYPAALQLGAQMLLALIAAHEKGVVHRDIKPDNVFLLNQSGVRLHVRVLDFGIARIYRQDDRQEVAKTVASSDITLPGSVLGTPKYMAPEQLAGDFVDFRADLYSAALVLFEAMTGTLPQHGGRTLKELCPAATPDLEELLNQCLRRNPAERPGSAAEVYLRLHELGKASGALILSPETLRQLSTQFQRSIEGEATQAYVPPGRITRRKLMVGGLCLLAALTGFFFFLPKSTPRPSVESLLGLKIGDSRDDVIDRLGKPSGEHSGDPWRNAPELLENLVRPEDLPAGESTLLTWDSQHVGVVLKDSKIQAIVVRSPHKAVSGRNVKIGDSERRLKESYDEPDSVDKVVHDDAEGPKNSAWGLVFRYPALGICFEVRHDKVTRIALCPKR